GRPLPPAPSPAQPGRKSLLRTRGAKGEGRPAACGPSRLAARLAAAPPLGQPGGQRQRLRRAGPPAAAPQHLRGEVLAVQAAVAVHVQQVELLVALADVRGRHLVQQQQHVQDELRPLDRVRVLADAELLELGPKADGAQNLLGVGARGELLQDAALGLDAPGEDGELGDVAHGAGQGNHPDQGVKGREPFQCYCCWDVVTIAGSCDGDGGPVERFNIGPVFKDAHHQRPHQNDQQNDEKAEKEVFPGVLSFPFVHLKICLAPVLMEFFRLSILVQVFISSTCFIRYNHTDG
ncbi:unnamed protein product, partial [Heterosigma akashiwo]